VADVSSTGVVASSSAEPTCHARGDRVVRAPAQARDSENI
jgi:hypothetical protein